MPIERLASEREILRPLPSLRPPLRSGERRTVDRRGSIRFGSARYLVPASLVGQRVEVAATEDKIVIQHAGAEIVCHDPVGPGEVAFGEYADPKRRPTRGIRPRTSVEVAFLGLGPVAETFLRRAATAGTLRLESELAGIVELVPIWGPDTSSEHSIVRLDSDGSKRRMCPPFWMPAAVCPPRCAPAGGSRWICRWCPFDHSQRLRAGAGRAAVMSTAAPVPQDVIDGLRRLRLATSREQAAEVLQTARTQRWPPEDVPRTLITAEIAGREHANRQIRLKQAGFPATKTLESFDVGASSIPRPTFDYVASLEWIRAPENLLLVGPAGTGKSHSLIGVGYRAVERGPRVRYFVAADLVEALYRGLADNTVGKLIHAMLRNDLVLIDELGFAPLDETGSQLFVPVRGCGLRAPQPWAGKPLAIRTMGPFLTRANHRGFAPRSPPPSRDRRGHVG